MYYFPSSSISKWYFWWHSKGMQHHRTMKPIISSNLRGSTAAFCCVEHSDGCQNGHGAAVVQKIWDVDEINAWNRI